MAHSEHRQSRAMVQSSPWLVEEYEAGYKARSLDIAQYMTATPELACRLAGGRPRAHLRQYRQTIRDYG